MKQQIKKTLKEFLAILESLTNWISCTNGSGQ